MRSYPQYRFVIVALVLLSAVAAVPSRAAGKGPGGLEPFTSAAGSAAVAAAEPLVRDSVPAPAVGPRSVTAAVLAEGALDALASRVDRQSHPAALRRAFEAYFNYRAAHPKQVRKPYLYFVDFGLDSRSRRGYVFDMETLRLVDGPFTVAHGRGSGGLDGVPTRFSNVKNSAATSLGLYLAQETYAFSGRAGGKRYRSPGLRLRGVSGPYNSAARSRGIVVHGAPYVTADRAGRSEGCPAMEMDRARDLIPKLANGGVVFLFSPRDRDWMERMPWAG